MMVDLRQTEKHTNEALRRSKLQRSQDFCVFVAKEMKAFYVNQEKVNWISVSFEE